MSVIESCRVAWLIEEEGPAQCGVSVALFATLFL